jgi:hypothetical protein
MHSKLGPTSSRWSRPTRNPPLYRMSYPDSVGNITDGKFSVNIQEFPRSENARIMLEIGCSDVIVMTKQSASLTDNDAPSRPQQMEYSQWTLRNRGRVQRQETHEQTKSN